MSLPPRRLRALALALPLLVGCAAQRTLKITSEPPGATIRIDGETVGATPMRIPFHHYGVRRVTLYHEGYLTHSEPVQLEPKWYARFPFDLFSEVLFPIGWKDRRAYHVSLVEGADLIGVPTLRSVIERSSALRHAGPEGPGDLPAPEPAQATSDQETGEGGP